MASNDNNDSHGVKNQSHQKAFNKKGLYLDAVTTRKKCTGFSIDTAEAKLLDDGLNLRQHGSGDWTVEFFIADTILFHETVGSRPYIKDNGLNKARRFRAIWLEHFGLKATEEQKEKPAVRVKMNFNKDAVLKNYSIDRVTFENHGPLFRKDTAKLRADNPKKWAPWDKFAAKVERRYINDINYTPNLVKTFATFTNIVLATYAHENKLPIFYNTDGVDLNEVDFKSHSSQKIPARSFLSTRPSGFSTLKSQFYAKFTSPMQRVTDAINLQIIVHHTEKRPALYSKQEMNDMVAQVNSYMNRKRRRKCLNSHKRQKPS